MPAKASWPGNRTRRKVQLPDAEQMIDDLDRIMTAYGTISVKTPDVWGQDRLAKFRSEYESQMAEWLKPGFKGDINASVRRSEAEATQVQVGASLIRRHIKGATRRRQTSDASLDTRIQAQASMNASAPGVQLSRRQDAGRRSSPPWYSTSTRII